MAKHDPSWVLPQEVLESVTFSVEGSGSVNFAEGTCCNLPLLLIIMSK